MTTDDPDDASQARVRKDFERRVEVAAEAHFERQTALAREKIDSSNFTLSELENFIVQIRSESETAQILIFYSYFEDRLRMILESLFYDLESANARDRLFGMNGPLNTFYSRSLIAYHLGWISDETKRQLDAMRKIRNEFAHRAFKVSLSDPALKNLADEIGHDDVLDRMLQVACDVSAETVYFPQLQRTRTLCKLILLALRTFEDLLVLPVARQYAVPPAAIASPYESAPVLLRRLRTASTRAVLLAVGEELEGDPVW